MKRSIQWICAITLLAVLIAGNAYAYDIINVTLKDPSDNYIDEANQTANNGSSENLSVQSWVSGDIRSILEFDEVSDIFTNSNFRSLDSAILRLYNYENLNISVSRIFSANGITTSWAELDSTWLDADGSTAWTTVGGDYTITGSDTASVTITEGWIEWDVTDIMQGWVDEYLNNGIVSDYGFLIKDQSEGSELQTYTHFYSSNSTFNGTKGPELALQYQAVPEASTIGLFGLGLIGGFISYWKKTSKILRLNYNKDIE